MNRSGYVDDYEYFGLYRGTVTRAIRGKRGQAFLRELIAALDALPEPVLIADELINPNGDCCAIGAVCKARGTDVSLVDPHEPEQVANAVQISRTLAAEIEFENDERSPRETPHERWSRMRKWAVDHLVEDE